MARYFARRIFHPVCSLCVGAASAGHFTSLSGTAGPTIHAMNQVDLLFLGTGTSAGVPMIGCYCDVCTSPDPRDKRMRPSVLISYANTKVLIDTTPELRLQCIANRIDWIDAIVYTHAHADHIMGLDDVRRFNAL